MPKFDWIKKTIILGSGAIKIAEAGEFDYSGSQAIKALKEEGVKTILVNPNIATIQTDPQLADKVYLLPVTPYFVEKVIAKERPDSILLGFGGQTALNCGVQLAKSGVLEKYGVQIIGTSLHGIEVTEDRDLFCKAMEKADIPTPRSRAVTSVEEAREEAEKLGYPVMVRVAYNLGGRGSGVAYNEYELDEIVRRGIANSMIGQVLIEEYVGHWKQVEYEVMRDYDDNCIIVCNMENVFGMRIHTGDNVVVAPSQTLTNREYHILRSASIRAVRACGIVGECNIQFALDPNSERFYAIEINPRLSRSSALASKATGYPLAYMAAKLALGYTLPELINKVTRITTACFEPALDYVVVKIPRWDLDKFERATRRIGTQMKSVGEVMAVGRCFEEALQKAIRMLDKGKLGLVANPDEEPVGSIEELEHLLLMTNDDHLFNVVRALRAGLPIERVSKLSNIDEWFIRKIKNLLDMEEKLRKVKGQRGEELKELLKEAKRLGFSDRQIAVLWGVDEEEVRKLRLKLGIKPVVKQIDTLAAEWPAQTNYLYVTYGGDDDDVDFTKGKRKVIVLGAGTYRIGSSVEFDWCTMNMVWSLKEQGIDQVIVINCNPETVSTDYDMSDKLYFDELTYERVLDIYEKEKPLGVITCVGGQTPNNLAPKLAKAGVRILGTAGEDVDRAEDRSKFSKLLDELSIPQPKWSKFTSIEEAEKFAEQVSYPVLVRPSYVLSGAAMRVAWSKEQLKDYLIKAAKVSPEHPVVISKFIEGALEVEVDGVSDGEKVLIGAVIEHVERAGIHSGDATMVIPPQRLSEEIMEKVKDYACKIARALRIKGPFNIQFVVKNDEVYVIECNLRASRSMPFVSKVKAINLMKLSAPILLGKPMEPLPFEEPPAPCVGIKTPQFSFMQVEGADPTLGVEMRSTGEVACLGEDFFDAFLKSLIAAGFRIPQPNDNILITIGGDREKEEAVPIAKTLRSLGYNIYATEHTAEHLVKSGVNNVKVVYKIREKDRKPNIADLLGERAIHLVINVPSTAPERQREVLEDEYVIRRKATELGVPVITTIEGAIALVKALAWMRWNELTVNSLNEYHERAPLKIW
ncbi:MAG: carbamoyl phosphate synthase large subunit [Thermoprotei archaeon]|nr:MAG: carbamoyl phosphate synthase large subunit [Thermoprotei archaeon]